MLPLASTYEVDIAVKHGHISNMFMTILRVLKGGSYLNFLSTDFNEIPFSQCANPIIPVAILLKS